jgi:long-chain acyl-CoA synthetase
MAAGLVALGLAPGQRVGLMGKNHPRWVAADYAIQLAGGVVVPIYVSSSAEQVGDILTGSGAVMCFVDDHTQRALLEEAKVSLDHVILFEGEGATSLERLQQQGRSLLSREDDILEERLAGIGPDDVHSVIFTSGTLGKPKAAVLTHTNMIWTADAACRAIGLRQREILLSYLPLSHVLERQLATAIPMVAETERWSTWFVSDIVKLPAALRQVRPTVFVGAPIVYERMRARVMAERAAAPSWLKLLAAVPGPMKRYIAKKVLARIGLDRCWYAVSGAAALAPETQTFFLDLGVPLHQGYGMTETSGLCTAERPGHPHPGSVGPPFDGVEVKIGEDGEILVRGPNVFQGYENDSEITSRALGSDGWLHTGDLGTYESGILRIVDRKGNLIVTAGGRKVAPQMIEHRLSAAPLIEAAMVIGDNRPYLVALLSLDATTAAALAGIDFDRPLWEHPSIRDEVSTAVDEVNRTLATPDAIRGWTILPVGFPDEALTPTLKIKRKAIEDLFSDEIEAMYG